MARSRVGNSVMPSATTAHRLTYFAREVTRACAAEGLFLAGNVLPKAVARPLWRLTGRLNPHHIGAALNLARSFEPSDPRAFRAFTAFLAALENPQKTS